MFFMLLLFISQRISFKERIPILRERKERRKEGREGGREGHTFNRGVQGPGRPQYLGSHSFTEQALENR
jgi:hypothetical protein